MPETALNVVLLRHTPEPEEVVAMAAKLCYSSSGVAELKEKIEAKDQAAFVKKLASLGHLTPIEHVSFSFGIEGISRACSHQLVRHRVASHSQQSQRYVKEEQFDYVVPPSIKGPGTRARVREVYGSGPGELHEGSQMARRAGVQRGGRTAGCTVCPAERSRIKNSRHHESAGASPFFPHAVLQPGAVRDPGNGRANARPC